MLENSSGPVPPAEQSPTAMAAAMAPTEVGAEAVNFFADLNALKLSIDAAGISGASEVLSVVEVRKPKKEEFFRVRSDSSYSFTTVIYENQVSFKREYYFVAPAMIPALRKLTELSVATLVPFYTQHKVLGIFPVKMPTDTSPRSPWHDSSLNAVNRAKSKWVRMQADPYLGAYRLYEAIDDLGEPEWPDTPFNELLDVAFRGRVITSVDHPVLNKLEGRI